MSISAKVAEAEATSQGTGERTEADLDKVLSGQASDDGKSVEEVETDSPTEDADAGASEEVTADADESSDADQSDEEEAAEGDDAEGEAEEESSEFAVEDGDRDYSQAAYEKAARIFSKNLKLPEGQEFDPSNAKDRAALKEMMDRGEAFKALQAKNAEGTEEEAEEAESTEDKSDEAPKAPTDEQIAQLIQKAQETAKSRIQPKVAMHVANRFIKSLWPDEKFVMTQERANDFTAALSEFFWMQLEDAGPNILGAMYGSMAQHPVMGRVQREAVRAAAFEELDGKKDAQNQPLYPDIEKMVDTGRLKAVIKANPWIEKLTAGNGRDDVKNAVVQFDAAYKIARGEQTADQVKQAVNTGKKQADDRAKKIATGRVAAGTTKGEIENRGKKTPTKQLMDDMVAGGGSRFSAAVQREAPQRKG